MKKNTTPGTLLLVSAFIAAVLSLIQLSGDSDAAYGLRFHALLLVVCSLLACSQTALRSVLFAAALAGSALWLALLPFNGLSTLALALLAAVSDWRAPRSRLPPSPRCSASGCCGSGRFWSPALPFRRSSCLRHWIFSRR